MTSLAEVKLNKRLTYAPDTDDIVKLKIVTTRLIRN